MLILPHCPTLSSHHLLPCSHIDWAQATCWGGDTQASTFHFQYFISLPLNRLSLWMHTNCWHKSRKEWGRVSWKTTDRIYCVFLMLRCISFLHSSHQTSFDGPTPNKSQTACSATFSWPVKQPCESVTISASGSVMQNSDTTVTLSCRSIYNTRSTYTLP